MNIYMSNTNAINSNFILTINMVIKNIFTVLQNLILNLS